MKYEEDYVGALECFSRAQALDPTWGEPKEQEAYLVCLPLTLHSKVVSSNPLSTCPFYSHL